MADPTVTNLFNIPIDPNKVPGALQAPTVGMTPVPQSAVAQGPAPQAQPTSGLTEEDEAWKARHSGVAGVARSVLGNLGDFLLSHLGVQPMYNKSQQQHKLNYAFDQGGQSSDPAQQLDAINKVQAVDFATGSKLRDQFIDNQRLQAQQSATIEARQQRLGLAQDAADQRTRTVAGSMLGTMFNWNDAKKEKFYPQMRQQVLTAAKRQGLDLSAELPETYDGNALDAFIDGTVPVGTQRAQRLVAQKQEDTKDYRDANLAERTNYHGRMVEQGDRRITVTQSHNDATEDNATNSTNERIRHDGVTEQQGKQNGARADRRLDIAAARPSTTRVPRPLPTDARELTYLRAHPEMRDKFDAKYGLGASKKILGN